MLRGRRRLSDEKREYEDQIQKTREEREVLSIKDKKRDREAEEALLRRERYLDTGHTHNESDIPTLSHTITQSQRQTTKYTKQN
jgi:hypothetical protein